MDLAAKLTAHFEDNIAATQRSMQTLNAPMLRAIDLCFGSVTNNAKF